MPRAGRAGLALLVLSATAGCGLLFPATTDPAAAGGTARIDSMEPTSQDALPGGLGTLRQDEISIHLRRGELQVQVTPLDETVIRVTAPDTYERLSALGAGLQDIFRERTGSAVPFQLFLVSLYSETAEVAFEPEALTLVNRGLRYRPVEIRAVTPGWDSRLLEPRRPLMAVYAFPDDLDLERSLDVEYEEVRSREWQTILPAIQRERSRVQTRSLGPD